MDFKQLASLLATGFHLGVSQNVVNVIFLLVIGAFCS